MGRVLAEEHNERRAVGRPASGSPGGQRATIADVARLSGLSRTAVSLILNNRPGSRLSQEAIARVQAAAAELGYRPNPMAQSLRLGRTRSIGFVSDEVTVTRPASGILRGLLATARAHDHSVLISETSGDMSKVEEAIRILLDRHVDALVIGLVVARLVDVPDLPDGMPVVIVNGRTSNDLPSVLPDEATGGREVAQTLLTAGHRRIGIVSDVPEIAADPRRSVSIQTRFQHCTEALTEAGVEPVWSRTERWDPAVGYQETLRVMRAHPDLTALVAGCDQMAMGIYQGLTELGLRVPEDVSVISFDDEEVAELPPPGAHHRAPGLPGDGPARDGDGARSTRPRPRAGADAARPPGLGPDPGARLSRRVAPLPPPGSAAPNTG